MPTTQMLVDDRYRLVEPLGQGGMGRVWKARDEILGREVAIKELVPPPGLSADERAEVRERAMREARAVARLNHPGIVRIHDVVSSGDGDPWIVMEYLPGGSLHDLLNREGTLPARRAARIGLDLLGALRATHAVGIVHRDIKPANVLMAEDGRAVLTDFGIATVPGDPFVTRTGLLLGSPAYLAPERARGGGKAGTAGDLWSLGATLFAATEGSPPFARATTMETLAALATEPIPVPRRAGELAPVLNGLLDKDPETRIGVDEAYHLLEPLARSSGSSPSAPYAAEPKPRAEKARTKTPAYAPGKATPVKPPPEDEDEPVTRPIATGRPSRTPSTASTSSNRTRKALLFAVIVALVIAGAALAYDKWKAPEISAPGPTTSPAPSSATSPPTPTTQAQSPTAAPSPAKSDGFVLPQGWQMREDGTGFRVPVPEGWRFGRDDDGRAFWRDPSSGVLLLIDQTRQPKADPVKDWENNEAARRGGYRDYKRVRLEKVTYWDNAADWEFTYTSDGGNPLHVLNRGFVTAPDQAYSIYWSTPAAQWESLRDDLQIVLDGFIPARS